MDQSTAASGLFEEQPVSSKQAFRVFQHWGAMGEIEITGCFARSWAAFEAVLADWLNQDAVKSHFQDRQILIVRSAEEEEWYMICAIPTDPGELRFLLLTSEDRTRIEAGIAMAVANFYSPELEGEAEQYNANQKERIRRLLEEHDWLARIHRAAIVAV